jgi:hypothetical protein
MADNGISKDEMADLFERFMGGKAGGKSYNPDDLESFTKSLKRSTDELKKSQPGFKGLQDFLGGVKTSKDSFNSLREQLDDLDKQIEKTAKSTKDGAVSSDNVAKVSALNAQKRELANAAASKATKAALGNLAIGVGEFATSMAEGAVSFVKGLQDGASGSQLATDAAKNFAKSGAEAASSVAGFGQSVGMVMTLVGGPWVKAIGAAIEVIGMFVDFFAKKSGKAAAEAAELLGKELQKTQKGFKDITEAGAVFGGGMTEMRKTAAEAGLDIAQLATVVKGSREDLTMMGIGAGEATKRLAGVSKELRNSDLGIQLRKLGFTAEEQVELSAGVMANMNAAGNARILNEKQIAEETVKYGKDLKILADVTGQDAKKVAEKARVDSLKAVLDAQLTDKQRDAYQGILRGISNYPTEIQEAILQKIAGGPITNTSAILAMQNNAQLASSVDLYAKTVKDGTLDNHQAQQLALEETGKIGKAQKEANQKALPMLKAGLYSQDATIQGFTKVADGLTVIAAKQKDGAAKTAKDNVDAQAENMKPLDVAVADLEENTQHLKAALGKELTNAVTGFAEAASKGLETLDDALSKFGVETKGGAAKRVAAEAAAQASGAGGQRSSSAVGAGSAMVGGAGGEGDAGAIMEAAAAGGGGPAPGKTATGAAAGGGGPAPGKTAEQLIKFNGGITGNKSNFDNLNADVKSKFMAMIAEYGKPVTVTSGARTDEEQALIDSGKNPKAKPGHSLHNIGRAIDLDHGDVNALKAAGLLQKYGFQGLAKDPVHIQMAANGASLTGSDVAIVGESGPELVQGPGSVTSRADTSELFRSMNSNMEAMLRVLKDHKDISEKTLWATS